MTFSQLNSKEETNGDDDDDDDDDTVEEKHEELGRDKALARIKVGITV